MICRGRKMLPLSSTTHGVEQPPTTTMFLFRSRKFVTALSGWISSEDTWTLLRIFYSHARITEVDRFAMCPDFENGDSFRKLELA